MSQLRTAVIGVGALGRHHARILSTLPGAELVAVVDTHEDQGRKVASDCGTTWHADCTTLPELDAVCVAVPTHAHLAVAAPFLEQGISVLVEKPIAGSVTEARELVGLAQRGNCVLQVGHVERFNPAMVAARDRLTCPRFIRAERLSPYTFRSTDIGVVLDLMIHDLDLILSMVDSPVESVEAFGVAVFGDTEDIAQARVRFRNGCIADLSASRVNPQASRSMQVWCENGCTTIDFGDRSVQQFGPGPALLAGRHMTHPPTTIEERAELMKSVFGRFIAVEELTVTEHDALTAELAEFVQCCREGRQPSVSGVEALAALEVADLIVDNIATHCWDHTPAGRVGPRVAHPTLRAA